MMEPQLSVPPPLATLPESATPFSQHQRMRQQLQQNLQLQEQEYGGTVPADADSISEVEHESDTPDPGYGLGNAQDISIGGVSVSSQGTDEERPLPPRAAHRPEEPPQPRGGEPQKGDALQDEPPPSRPAASAATSKRTPPPLPAPTSQLATTLFPPSPASSASPPRSPSTPPTWDRTRIHTDPVKEAGHPYATSASPAAAAVHQQQLPPPSAVPPALLTSPSHWQDSSRSDSDSEGGPDSGRNGVHDRSPQQQQQQQRHRGERIRELVKEKERAEAALSELQRLFEGLTHDYDTVSRDAQRANTELSVLRAHTAAVEEELGLVQTRAAAQAQRIAQFNEEWETKSSHLRRQHDTLRAERDTLLQQRNDLLDGHRTLRLQVEHFQQGLAEAKEGYDRKCRAQAREAEDRVRASYREKEDLLRLREQELEREAKRVEEGLHTVATENASARESADQLRWRLKELERVGEKKDLLRGQLERSLAEARARLAEVEQGAENARQQHAQRARDVEDSWRAKLQEAQRLHEAAASDKSCLEKELRAQQKRHAEELALREESRKEQWDRAADCEWALRTEIRKLKEQLSKAMESQALEAAARQRIVREFERLTDATRPLQERLALTEKALVDKSAQTASLDTKLNVTLVRLDEKEKEAETYRTALQRSLWVEQIDDAARSRDALLSIKWGVKGKEMATAAPPPGTSTAERASTVRPREAAVAAGPTVLATDEEGSDGEERGEGRRGQGRARAVTPARPPPSAQHVETIERTANAKPPQQQRQPSLPPRTPDADEVFFDNEIDSKGSEAWHGSSLPLRSQHTSPARPPRSPSSSSAVLRASSPWRASPTVPASAPQAAASQHPYGAAAPHESSYPLHHHHSSPLFFGSTLHSPLLPLAQQQQRAAPRGERFAPFPASSPLPPRAGSRESAQTLPPQQLPADVSSIYPLSFTSPPPAFHGSELDRGGGPEPAPADTADPTEERMIRKAVREVLRRQQQSASNTIHNNNNNNVSVSTVSTADSAAYRLPRATQHQQPSPPKQRQDLSGHASNRNISPSSSTAVSGQGLFHSMNTSWQSLESQSRAGAVREGSFIGLGAASQGGPETAKDADPVQGVLDSYAQSRTESVLRVRSTLDELAERQQRLLASVTVERGDASGGDEDDEAGGWAQPRAVSSSLPRRSGGWGDEVGGEASPQPRASAAAPPSTTDASQDDTQQRETSAAAAGSPPHRPLARDTSAENATMSTSRPLHVAALHDRFSSSA